MPITAANGQTYSDDQIKSFFASSPTNDAIAQQASALGLNADQIAQAANIAGKNWTSNDVKSAAQNMGYNFNGSNGGIINNAASQQPTSLQVGNNNYTADQVKGWMNGKTADQVAQQAVNMGLTQDQIRQAYQMSGQTLGANDISNYANRIGVNFNGTNGGAAYNANPNAAGWNAQGGSNGMESGTLTTRGGKQVSHAQLAAFAASNPTDQQILAQAAQWGMSAADINTALNNLGLLYNGSPTSVQLNDPKNGSIWNRLSNEIYTGSQGFGLEAGPNSGANPYARIVQGNGHTLVDNGDGSQSWVPYGNNTAGGIINNAMYPPGGGVTSMGIGSTNPPPSNTSLNGSTNWNITTPQTVAGQMASLNDSNNPYIQQARAKAMAQMNERGLTNSSLAQTAADTAAYQASLPIAQADASVNADSAKTNATAQNQFALTQNQAQNTLAQIMASGKLNQQTQLAVTNLSGRFGQLSNVTGGTVNLSGQYAAGLQSIMSNPNLDASARNAAVAQLNAQYDNALTLLGQINDPTAPNSPVAMVQGILNP